MRKFLTVPLCFFLVAALWADDQRELKTGRPSTARYGTAIEFVEMTPPEAAKLAKKERKLVMVIHVSGYFEDPDFT